MNLRARLKCLLFGHNFIIDYPWSEQYSKNGKYYLVIYRLNYCNRCKKAYRKRDI